LAELLSLESNNQITADHLIVTAGAMEAGQIALIGIVHPGENIGIVTPDYATHFSQTRVSHAKEMHIPMIEGDNKWCIDLGAIEHWATTGKGLKALLITNPNNPTGSVISPEQLQEINRLSLIYGFWVISDETYSYLTYEQPFTSFLKFVDVNHRVLVSRSFSKEHCMTGWRVGYLAGEPETMTKLLRVHDPLVGTATRISQMAALGVLEGSQAHVKRAREDFFKKREFVVNELSNMDGVRVIAPEGAYYVFPKYDQKIASLELSRILREEYGVNVIPGAIFGEGGENHFRVSMGPHEDKLKDGISRIGDFFSKNS